MTKPQSISRLTLGTAQFGSHYGLANTTGKPSYETCRDIVAKAVECGIRCIDTATAYGDSETLLGRAIAELKIKDEIVVVSKSYPFDFTALSVGEIESRIEKSLLESLANLQLDSLPVFLFHREHHLSWISVLEKLRQRGLIQHIGISADSENGAWAGLDDPLVSAMQLPFNLLDHRFSREPFLQKVESVGTILFARSAFLQGLLLMPEEKIPAFLQSVVPVRRKVEQLAEKAGMSMPELCLRYSLSFPAITSVLIGVETVDQVEDNANTALKGPLDPGLVKEIQAAVPDFPEDIVRPSLWPKP